MSDRDTLIVLAEELALALQPLSSAFVSQQTFRDFLLELGWDFENVPSTLNSLQAPVDTIFNLVNNVDDLNASEFTSLLSGIRASFDAISNLQSGGGLSNEFKNEFPRELVDYLIA